MELNERFDSRLVRTVLAVALAATALRSLRSGKRARGVLAGVGAAVLGYTLVGDASTTGVRESETETTTAPDTGTEEGERTGLTCAACGRPIRLGQRRKPNAEGEVVHEGCLPAE